MLRRGKKESREPTVERRLSSFLPETRPFRFDHPDATGIPTDAERASSAGGRRQEIMGGQSVNVCEIVKGYTVVEKTDRNLGFIHDYLYGAMAPWITQQMPEVAAMTALCIIEQPKRTAEDEIVSGGITFIVDRKRGVVATVSFTEEQLFDPEISGMIPKITITDMQELPPRADRGKIMLEEGMRVTCSVEARSVVENPQGGALHHKEPAQLPYDQRLTLAMRTAIDEASLSAR